MFFGQKAKYRKLAKQLKTHGVETNATELQVVDASGGNAEDCLKGVERARELGVPFEWGGIMGVSLTGNSVVEAAERAARDLAVTIDRMRNGGALEGNCRNGDRVAASVEIVYRAPLQAGGMDTFPWSEQFAVQMLQNINASESAEDLSDKKRMYESQLLGMARELLPTVHNVEIDVREA